MPLDRFARFAGLALLLAAMASAAPASAQSIAFGSLAGKVVDAAGRPVPDVEIRLVDQSSGAERNTVTSRDGRFRFGLLSVAHYDVVAEAIGFRPLVQLGVLVEPGTSPTLTLSLRSAAPPVVTRDTLAARATAAVPLMWLAERGYGDVTGSRRTIGDLASLSPLAGADGIEGLPWRHAEIVIDGARLSGVANPATSGRETIGLAVPTRGLALGTVGGVGFDVEMGGTGTGLAGTTLRGGQSTAWRSAAEGGTSGIGAALSVGGPVQRDTAYAVAGADYQRSAVITPAWFPATDALGLQLADIALNTHATDLLRYTEESERIEERWSGFTRFDWLQGEKFALTFRASGSRLALRDPSALDGVATGLGSSMEATAAQLSVDLISRITNALALEFRVSGDLGEASADLDGPLPPTAIAARGLILGAPAEEPYSDSRTTPRATGIVHFDVGAHRLKAGIAVASHRLETRLTRGSRGEFAFGDAIDFANLSGVYREVDPEAGSAAFRLDESAFFVQDSWAVTDALTLTAGVRMDGMRLPAGDHRGNAAWRAASGLGDAGPEASQSRVAPRIGFRWAFGTDRSWLLQGGAGVFNSLPDTRDIGEARALGRGADVRVAVGTLGSWPATPGGLNDLGQTVSFLGDRFESPRTQRLSLGVQRRIGGWTAYASGVHRHTDYLTRRVDLNAPAAAVGTDQHGRPLFGQLQQLGALVVATPGTNRRFAGFDAAYALDVTGFSDFTAISVGVDRVVEHGVSLAVNYTYASSEDNLIDERSARISPFATGLDGSDWNDGPSSQSAPHRALVAVDWTPAASGALRLGAVYRVRSGAAFTPGFRVGVDANGDGDGGNDPAFVDPSAPGMDALLAANDCLRSQAGAFATRNSCRGDFRQQLDLRLAIRLTGGTGGGTHLVLDAMNIVSPASRPDAALFLIDRTGALSTNALTGVTTLPLTVNPAFGETLADRSPGLLWRIGLRIGR